MGQGPPHQQKSEGKDSSRTPKTLLGNPEWGRGHESRAGLQGAQHGCGHGPEWGLKGLRQVSLQHSTLS